MSIGATALLECPACDGVWLTSDEFERICANREAQAAVLHRWSGAPHAAAAGQVRYRPCVQCGTMMNRVNFGRLSGTIVDVCRGHGTFLDSGELHAIVAFVQGGGLDRMRARDIADLRDEQRRLREAQAATMRRSREDPPSALKVLDWTTGDLFSIIDLLKKD